MSARPIFLPFDQAEASYKNGPNGRLCKPPAGALFDFALVELRGKPSLLGCVVECSIASAGFLKIHILNAHGEFRRVILHSVQEVSAITPMTRQQALAWAGRNEWFVKADLIIDTVCEFYHVTREMMLDQKRGKGTDHARQTAIYLCDKLTGQTQVRLGEIFKRHLSAISHACVRCKDDIANYPEVRGEVNAIHYKLVGSFLPEEL